MNGRSLSYMEWSMTYPAPELTLCQSRRAFGEENIHTDIRWEFSLSVQRILHNREIGMY